VPIDWFTIAAQIINFFILIFLLKKFLYRPVIRAMEEREKRIANALEQAKNAEKEARAHAESLAARQQDFLENKEKMLADAKAEIEKWHEIKIAELRMEIDDMRQSWTDNLDRERRKFLTNLKKDTIRHIMNIGNKVIRDLADQQLEARIIAVFMEKIENEKKYFQSEKYAGTVQVISGFGLSEKVADDIRKKFSQWLPSSEPVRFETSRDLGMGIEVFAGDKKIAWNLDKYLIDLEKEILLVFPSKTRNAA